jgi:hypothetical protein
MMTPATILRDTTIAGFVLSALGGIVGADVSAAIAAGALACLVNFGLLVRVVGGANPDLGGFFLARLALKQLAGAVILYFLLSTLPAGPVLIGFSSVMCALAVGAVARLAAPPPSSILEPG